MTAEPIAAVIADIRAGQVRHPAAVDEPGIVVSLKALNEAQRPQPVVDCTAIFQAQRSMTTIQLYEDHPQVTPPWDDALLCYVNTYGNVICMQVHRKPWDGTTPDIADWYTQNSVDWPRVRWIAETTIWVGGRDGERRDIPTSGPVHMIRHAIRDDGAPEDINWVGLLDRKRGLAMHGSDPGDATWEPCLITLTGALNFLNASNVDIAEPSRPRPERRRLARTGVTVQTVVVRPPGKHRVRGGGARPIGELESVLSPVRGHWARYGERFGRGKLFGKYEGKFWIPGHVRGAGEDAPVKDYLLKPGAAA